MKLGKVVKSNFIFLFVILAFNYLFYLQQTQYGDLISNLGVFEAKSSLFSSFTFFFSLTLVSLFFSVLSLPGAGFTFSLGGYLYGMNYLLVAGFILYLASLLSFKLVKRAKEKSPFFNKMFSSEHFSHLPKTRIFLFLFRMNPAVPFIFLVSFYKEKICFKTHVLLLFGSYFHALIYILVGDFLKTKTSNFNELLIYSLVFTFVSLIPMSLMLIFKDKLD